MAIPTKEVSNSDFRVARAGAHRVPSDQRKLAIMLSAVPELDSNGVLRRPTLADDGSLRSLAVMDGGNCH
jgi:hypothetical protein